MLRSKTSKVYFIIMLIGLAFVAWAFAYFTEILPGAVQPCSATYQASNCGDADFSGIGELFIGLPLFLIGLIGWIASNAVWAIRGKKRQ